MSPYDLLDPAVSLAHTLLTAIAEAVPGPVDGPALALAVVVLTALVRAAMLPLAVRALRTERARAALAPELARLRRRHAGDRERLSRELLAAHRAAGVGLLGGLGTALVQLPVVTTLYRVVVTPTVGGDPNVLVGAVVLGAPLTEHWPQVLLAAGVLSPPAAALAGLLLALAAVAYASVRQQAARTAALQTPALPGAALLRWLPYGTVAFAAAAPVAVGLYVLSTTAWTVAERAVLERLV